MARKRLVETSPTRKRIKRNPWQDIANLTRHSEIGDCQPEKEETHRLAVGFNIAKEPTYHRPTRRWGIHVSPVGNGNGSKATEAVSR